MDMTQPSPIPPIEDLKRQAKRLRASLAKDGDFISHSEALELIAHQLGYRDWNTLYAIAGNRPPYRSFVPGARVSGQYLSQPFTGEVIGVETRSGGRSRITIEFDEAVDVVTFDSFSAYRHRVTCVVDENGESSEKTSNGQPHMIVGAAQ
jgi:hypothetical protein